MNPELTCSQRQWLHSSAGRASHRYREVTGSIPVGVFSGFFTQLHKLRSLRRSFLHFHNIFYGVFLWDDPDEDQWSEIAWVITSQMNQWILLQGRIVGSLDLLQTKWSWITDPDTDHPNGTLSLCFFSVELKKSIPVKKWGMLFFSPIFFITNPKKVILWWIRILPGIHLLNAPKVLMNKYTSLKNEPLGAHMNEQ